MQVFTQKDQLVVKGQPAWINILILALLVILIPVTAWGMWSSGEVSIWFTIAFVLAFGLASPFILNDIIKPSFVKAVLDPAQKTIEITMVGLLKKQTTLKRFSDIAVVQLNIVDGHIERSGSQKVHNTKLKFNDGQETTVLKGSRASAVKADFEKLSKFLKASRQAINIQQNSISRKEMLRGRA